MSAIFTIKCIIYFYYVLCIFTIKCVNRNVKYFLYFTDR